MADAGAPEEETTGTASSLERSTDKLNSVVSGLNGSIDKFSGILSSLTGGAGAMGAAAGDFNLEKLMKAFESAKGDASRFRESVNREMSNISVSPVTRQFSAFGSNASGAFSNITKAAGSMMSFVEKNAGRLGEVLGSAGIIGTTKFQKAVIEKLGDMTGYNIAQKNLMEIQKQALQMGVSFDQALGDAESNFNFFNRSFRESIILTKSFPQEILEVQKGLKGAFGDRDIVANMGSLAKAQDNIKSSLNLQNTALLLNKAGLLDVGKATQYMSLAHTQLGEDIEGTALAFGRISESAKGSGIGFDATADAIFKSATALKMWGGTIGGVAPLFDMFSRSLKGTGREGLTPELLESFVGGLNRMTTGTKALLGIQAGMGAGGGAIGGALEIEEALEKGPEGMKKVVDSLTQTLTQFGGGRIITRGEAVRDPTAQANFLLQRQLLTKLIGVDEATATKTLDALSKMGDAGLQTGSNAEEALGQILGSGEKIADNTTTTMEQLSQQEVGAINAGAAGIIQATQALADKLDLGLIARGFNDAVQQAVISGKVVPEDIGRQLSRASRDRDTARERVQEARMTGRTPNQRQIAELNRAEQNVEALRAGREFNSILSRQMSESMERGDLTGRETVAAATTGEVPSRIAEEALSEITRSNADLITQLEAKMSGGTATPEEIRMYELITGSIRDLRSAISDGVQVQPSDLNIRTDTSSLERAAQEFRAGAETPVLVSPETAAIPPAPELPPLAAVQAPSPTQTLVPALPTTAPTRIQEMARREFVRPTPTAPTTDINAARLRTDTANRQAVIPNLLQELNVQRLTAESLVIPAALERLTESIDGLTRQPPTRDLVNTMAPEAPTPPVPAAITAANTARREEAEVAGTAATIPVQAMRQVREEREINIKVTLEGDHTIRLQPVVRKIVSDMHRENPEN